LQKYENQYTRLDEFVDPWQVKLTN
jgi:hypothetical protein